MLIVALVMAVIGLAALVAAVVTGDEVIAWACIGASVIGVILLIVDALRERQRRDAEPEAATEAAPEAAPDTAEDDEGFDAEYPDEAAAPDEAEPAAEVPEEDSAER